MNRLRHTHQTDGTGHHQSPDAALAGIAAENLGVIARAEALGVGLTDHQLRRRVANGVLIRHYPGVYRMASAPCDQLVHVLAAVKAAGPDALASGGTALELHGCDVPDALGPGNIHVLVTREHGPVLPGATVHTTRQLARADKRQVHRIPVTSVERALADVAGLLSWEETVALVDQAIGLGQSSARTIHQTAERLVRGRAGCRRLADITAPEGETQLRSWLERWVKAHLEEAGLPPFDWNEVLHDSRGRVGEVDALQKTLRIVLELDGPRFHSSPAQRRKDRERDRRLQLDGWLVLRFEWGDAVHRTEQMLSDIRSAVTSRQRG